MAKVKHVLNVQARTAGTTNDARRLRKTGLIPAIVYGKGIEPKCISVNATEWQLLSRNELNILSLVADSCDNDALLRIHTRILLHHEIRRKHSHYGHLRQRIHMGARSAFGLLSQQIYRS